MQVDEFSHELKPTRESVDRTHLSRSRVRSHDTRSVQREAPYSDRGQTGTAEGTREWEDS
jgi:hypothetical protein